jgi:putative lipoprotein (rSAM/lipoprotein system)
MNAKTVLDRVKEIANALDGVGSLGKRALYAAVPVAALATSGCNGAYGMPFATYSLDGTVVSAESGDPIEGIELQFGWDEVTSLTDAGGAWTLWGDDAAPGTPPTASVTVRDVDGAENGAYQDTEVDVPVSRTGDGSGDWDEGSFAAHDVVIELERL